MNFWTAIGPVLTSFSDIAAPWNRLAAPIVPAVPSPIGGMPRKNTATAAAAPTPATPHRILLLTPARPVTAAGAEYEMLVARQARRQRRQTDTLPWMASIRRMTAALNPGGNWGCPALASVSIFSISGAPLSVSFSCVSAITPLDSTAARARPLDSTAARARPLDSTAARAGPLDRAGQPTADGPKTTSTSRSSPGRRLRG